MTAVACGAQCVSVQNKTKPKVEKQSESAELCQAAHCYTNVTLVDICSLE